MNCLIILLLDFILERRIQTILFFDKHLNSRYKLQEIAATKNLYIHTRVLSILVIHWQDNNWHMLKCSRLWVFLLKQLFLIVSYIYLEYINLWSTEKTSSLSSFIRIYTESSQWENCRIHDGQDEFAHLADFQRRYQMQLNKWEILLFLYSGTEASCSATSVSDGNIW